MWYTRLMVRIIKGTVAFAWNVALLPFDRPDHIEYESTTSPSTPPPRVR